VCSLVRLTFLHQLTTMLHRWTQSDQDRNHGTTAVRVSASADRIIITKNPWTPELLSQGPKMQPVASEAYVTPSTLQGTTPFKTPRRRRKEMKATGCEEWTGSWLGATVALSDHSDETSDSKKAFHCLNRWITVKFWSRL
jgi:glycine/D-amino acid oxidase-like deaminating enzyme